MKSLTSLVRKGTWEPCRKTYGNMNIARRKEWRRLKKINYYNKEITGEQAPNSWVTPKRIKAMSLHIQTLRNNHIGSNPIPESIKKQLLETMPEISDYQYYLYRNRVHQIFQYEQSMKEANLDEAVSQLPNKLRQEVVEDEILQPPEAVDFYLKFSQQMQIFLPKEEKYRFNLLRTMTHPPKDKNEKKAD